MQSETHPSHRKSLCLLIIPLLTLVIASLACSTGSKPPVVYDDKASLLNDCRTLQENDQTVSLNGELSIRDETTCVSTSERIGSRCGLVLYVYDWGGLDIWMEVKTRNGMDKLPELGYNAWDLVVYGGDGERLGDGDMVTVELEPFLLAEKDNEECGFLVKTVEKAKMESNGDQPMEGRVDVEFPINLSWYDTGIRVQKGQKLIISDVGCPLCNMRNRDPAWEGPGIILSGLRDRVCDASCVVNGANYGMLAARIGDGPPLLISEDTDEFIAQTSGTLYFTINDCQDCYGDNYGNYHLVLTLSTP